MVGYKMEGRIVFADALEIDGWRVQRKTGLDVPCYFARDVSEVGFARCLTPSIPDPFD